MCCTTNPPRLLGLTERSGHICRTIGTMSDLLERAVARMKDSKESLHAEGVEWKCDLFVSRDGDAETSLDIVLIPGPVLMNNPDFAAPGDSVDTRRMALALAQIAVPGFGADRLIFCTDSYSMGRQNISRAEHRKLARRLEKDFKGSLNLAVQAGAQEELGINDAMVALLIERPESPDRLAKVSQRFLPYEVDGNKLRWLEAGEWSHLDDGKTKNGFSGGYVIDSLRECFSLPDLMNEAEVVWPLENDEPLPDPATARASCDVAVIQILAEVGAAMIPMIPVGPRADFIVARLKQFAEDHPDAFVAEDLKEP